MNPSTRNAVRLLEQYYLNARQTATTLETRLGVSRQTISKLKEALINGGIIARSTILINPIVTDQHIYFMELKTNPSEPRLLEFFKSLEEVENMDGILGEYSLIIKMSFQSKAHFARILNHIEDHLSNTRFQHYRLIEIIQPYKMGGFPINMMDKKANLKEEDWIILKILKKNINPKKWKYMKDDLNKLEPEEMDLFNKINISRKYTYYEKNSIIQRSTIALNPNKLKTIRSALYSKYYVRIQPSNIKEYTDLASKLKLHPNIIELYRTGETMGLLAIVRTRGLEGYNEFIKDLYKTYNILDTYTTVAVESILPEICPPTERISKYICNPTKPISPLDNLGF